MHSKSKSPRRGPGGAMRTIFGTLGLASIVGATAHAATIITFDVPNSTAINPASINNNGEIAGTYNPVGGGTESFVREPDGTFVLVTTGHKDEAVGIKALNDRGALTGFGNPGEGIHCVFYRDPNHHPIACGPVGKESVGNAINIHGVVAGTVSNSADAFVWDIVNGATTFNAPGAAETDGSAVNASGFVTGRWQDANSKWHGFVRDSAGTLTPFDVAGATDTLPTCISASGLIAGDFIDGSGHEHGFARDDTGTILVFDPQGSGNTNVSGINRKGTVVGSYFDTGAQFLRGFFRGARGKITAFDAGSTTFANAINDSGQITGSFVAGSTTHGFLRNP